MPLTSKNVINMTLTFDFDCLAFFGFCDVRALALGFRVILKNPCLITSDDSTKQVWFSLKTLDDVLSHQQAVLLLIIIQQAWHYFCTDFLHERRCKQKHVKFFFNKINRCRKLRLLLYTPKISQSAYPSFAHSSHSTPSPVTFQTDLVCINICVHIENPNHGSHAIV